MMLHHAGQRTQNSTDRAIPAPSLGNSQGVKTKTIYLKIACCFILLLGLVLKGLNSFDLKIKKVQRCVKKIT